MNKHAVMAVGSVVLILGGCGNNNKPSMEELLDVARRKGVIIYNNGLLSDETRKMTSKLAKDLEMVHMVGGKKEDLFKILDAAEQSEYGAQVVFHSAGASEAYDLVEECKKRDIYVRGVHSLDAFTSHEFPSNVRQVTNYLSQGPYLFGKQESRGPGKETRRIEDSNHLNLPWKAQKPIRGSIVGSKDKWARQKTIARAGK